MIPPVPVSELAVSRVRVEKVVYYLVGYDPDLVKEPERDYGEDLEEVFLPAHFLANLRFYRA